MEAKYIWMNGEMVEYEKSDGAFSNPGLALRSRSF